MKSQALVCFFIFIVIIHKTQCSDPIPYLDNIFILAGQSNMVGMGGVRNQSVPWDGIVPVESTPDESRVFRLNGEMTWEVATEPLHRDVPRIQNCGIGPGLPFANSVKGRVSGSIGLVPCAVSGTFIGQWQPGQQLYEDMINRATVAASSGSIKGLLWYQGENDSCAKDNMTASVYRKRMISLFEGVRRDLNIPNLPIIQVAIATGCDKLKAIRILQMGLEMANVTWVDAKGLGVNCHEPIHLSTDGEVRLGEMLADMYVAKFGNPPPLL